MLQNLGYVFLRPQDAHLERKGKLSNVLLDGILDGQLRRLNRIRFKGREHEFSDANIQAAIEALKDAPLSGGLMAASRRVYDLLSLGKSLEQTIDGGAKSFPINYVDWRRPERNVFHAVEEFEVQTQGGGERRLPDIILFVNGIPFVVIECRRPDEKDAIEEAISQHLRNQHGDQIPRLFVYAQLLLAVNGKDAAYGTTGTKSEFWSEWREGGIEDEVARLANRPLTRQQKENLYAGRGYLRQYFDELEMELRPATAQDRALYCLCRPERLIELTRQFIVFGDDAKKIARHQQYFAVKKAIEQIETADENGRRAGGVIWHAQGSGRFLTMVMLAKAIAIDPAIRDPRLVLVSDRAGLDDQIRDTVKSCAKEPARASTGKHLWNCCWKIARRSSRRRPIASRRLCARRVIRGLRTTSLSWWMKAVAIHMAMSARDYGKCCPTPATSGSRARRSNETIKTLPPNSAALSMLTRSTRPFVTGPSRRCSTKTAASRGTRTGKPSTRGLNARRKSFRRGSGAI